MSFNSNNLDGPPKIARYIYDDEQEEEKSMPRAFPAKAQNHSRNINSSTDNDFNLNPATGKISLGFENDYKDDFHQGEIKLKDINPPATTHISNNLNSFSKNPNSFAKNPDLTTRFETNDYSHQLGDIMISERPPPSKKSSNTGKSSNNKMGLNPAVFAKHTNNKTSIGANKTFYNQTFNQSNNPTNANSDESFTDMNMIPTFHQPITGILNPNISKNSPNVSSKQLVLTNNQPKASNVADWDPDQTFQKTKKDDFSGTNTINEQKQYLSTYTETVINLIENYKEFNFKNCVINGSEHRNGLGMVFLILDLITSIEYVLKLEKINSNNPNPEGKIYTIVKENGHPNLMTFIGHGVRELIYDYQNLTEDLLSNLLALPDAKECQFFVMEPAICSLQELLDYRWSHQIRWTHDEVLHLLVFMVRALLKLRELGVAHFDIKPSNILITDDKDVDGMWKLAGFNVSEIIPSNEEEVPTRLVGTEGSRAPELVATETGHLEVMINPYVADVYSLGVTVSYCFAASERNNDEYDGELFKLLGTMICVKPADRATAKELNIALEQMVIDFKRDLSTVKDKILKDSLMSREMKLKSQSTKNDDPFASLKIGMMYQNGIGVKKDIQEAIKWFQISAEQGNMIAHRKAEFHRQNEEASKDIKSENEDLDKPNEQLSTSEFSEGSCLNPAISFNNIGVLYKNCGEYEKAREYFIQALQPIEMDSGEGHPDTLVPKTNLAHLLNLCGQYNAAKECYLTVLQIRAMIYGQNENYPGTVSIYETLGALFTDAGDDKTAIIYFQKVLEINKDMNGEMHVTTMKTLAQIADSLLRLSQFDEAKKAYLQALEIKKKMVGEYDPSIASDYNNLGSKFFGLGQYNSAHEFYLKRLDLIKAKPRTNESAAAEVITYLNLANLHSLSKQPQPAEEYCKKSLELAKSVFEETNPVVLQVYSVTASLCLTNGKYEESKQYYTKLLEIQKKSLGDDHPDIALIYRQLAHISDKTNDLEKVIEYYSKAISIRKHILDPETANLYNNLGMACLRSKEYAKAHDSLMKALDICNSQLGERHQITASLYKNLAQFYKETEDYEKSKEFTQKALEITKAVSGENDPLFLFLLSEKGLLHSKSGQHQQAKECHSSVLQICQNSPQKDLLIIATACFNLGTSNHQTGDYEQAKNYYGEALKLRKAKLTEFHEDVASTYSSLAKVYGDCKDYEKAKECFLEVVKITKKLFGESSERTARVYTEFGLLNDSFGENKKAKFYQSLALKIIKPLSKEFPLDLATVYHNFGLFYKNHGEFEESKESLLKALEIRKKLLGDDHRDTILTSNALKSLLERKEQAPIPEPKEQAPIPEPKEQAPKVETASLVRLAICYKNGWGGFPKNISKAHSLFVRAKEQGSLEAMIHLGIMIQHGIGVEKDHNAAMQLFEEADRGGSSIALVYLANLFSQVTNEFSNES